MEEVTINDHRRFYAAYICASLDLLVLGNPKSEYDVEDYLASLNDMLFNSGYFSVNTEVQFEELADGRLLRTIFEDQASTKAGAEQYLLNEAGRIEKTMLLALVEVNLDVEEERTQRQLDYVSGMYSDLNITKEEVEEYIRARLGGSLEDL